MPVDKFGRTNVGTSQRVVSGGVTLSQVNNTFLRRDGENTATADINMDSHKLINVLDPANDHDTATKHYVDGRALLPYKKFLSPYATDLNTYIWKDYQAIPAIFSESEFDDLPAGLYACFTANIPATRLGSLPTNTKGYLITIAYEQPVNRNKYYKWINSTNGEEWEAYFKLGVWNPWVTSGKVSKSGDTMSGDLNMSGKLVTGLPVDYPPLYSGNEAVSWNQVSGLITDVTTNNATVPTGDNYLTNKKYVDDQDALKVAKTGDVMTGNLVLNVGTDLLRTLGCSDLSGSKGFNILLGSATNQIQCQLNQPIAIQATDGIVCRQGSTDIIRFGMAVGDLRTEVFQDILMNQNFIANLHDPNSAQDAATKNYADNLTKKCYSGYVPILEANASRLGFVASASSVAAGAFNPYGVFNSHNGDNANGSWVTPGGTTTGWLQIKCPEAITIWRVALKARPIAGRNITAWNIAASNDGTTFTTLLTSTTALLGSATAPSFFNISTSTAYQYYRFNMTASTGSTDVGVQVMQLYVLTTG